jgi:putative CocE/NonD family hydrolase
MRKVLLTLAVGMSSLGAVVPSHAAVPPAEFHYFTVSDGEEIAVRVEYPNDYVAGNEYPVLMTMEGYGGAGQKNDTTFDGARHDGYMLVSASIRGTGCSSGQLHLFSERSSLDGKEIIDVFLPRHDWFNGEVGLFGHSYSGLTGYLIAAQTPDNLTAIAVSGLIDDFYRGILFMGGIANPGFPVLFGAGTRPLAEHQGNQDELQSDEHCRTNYLDHQGSDLVPLQGALDTYPNVFADDEQWMITNGLVAQTPGVQVPIQMGQQYQDEQTGPRGANVLWEHINEGLPKRLTLSTGRHNPNDPHRTKADWLDCWIKHDGSLSGVTSNNRSCADVLDPQQRVHVYFESFGNDRLTALKASDWPLPNTDWTKLYLRSGQLAPPRSPCSCEPYPAPARYVNAPADRHLTGDVGGLGPGGLGTVGYVGVPADTAEFTLPFEEATAFAGPAVLNLNAMFTSPDTNLWAELLDRDTATGATTFIQRGLLRPAFRAVDDAKSPKITSGPLAGETYRPEHPFDALDPVIPGVYTDVQIEIFPFGHVFRPAHELVLSLHAPPVNDPISFYAYQPNAPSVVLVSAESTILLPKLPSLPPMRASAPNCGQVVGEVCVTPVR